MVREPLMFGSPPPAESRVTLANWQDPLYDRWSFQHLRELIPNSGSLMGPALGMPCHSRVLHRY